MYLDIVFIKYPNVSILPKKGISLCFVISGEEVIRNQKTTAKCY